MSKKGSAFIFIIVIIFVILGVGFGLYYGLKKPSTRPSVVSEDNQMSFLCPSDQAKKLLPYENQGMGIAFCYPSDMIVSTGTLSWPQLSLLPVGPYSNQASATITFSVSQTSSSISFAKIAGFETDGGAGSAYTVAPAKQQIINEKNQNGFNYSIFRYNIVLNKYDGPVTVWSTEGGPGAFIDLGNEYMMFSAGGFSILPTSTDSDLEEILNTVQVIH